MPIQNYNIYTETGYAGDYVDSGPRVTGTGVLVANASAATRAGFGLALMRQKTGTKIKNGVELGGAAKVFAISIREYNREASTRPAKKDSNAWGYNLNESASIMRQGFVYVRLEGTTGISAGDLLHVDTVTGEFYKDAVAGDIVATTNVTAESDALAGEILKVRIDVVA